MSGLIALLQQTSPYNQILHLTTVSSIHTRFFPSENESSSYEAIFHLDRTRKIPISSFARNVLEGVAQSSPKPQYSHPLNPPQHTPAPPPPPSKNTSPQDDYQLTSSVPPFQDNFLSMYHRGRCNHPRKDRVCGVRGGGRLLYL